MQRIRRCGRRAVAKIPEVGGAGSIRTVLELYGIIGQKREISELSMTEMMMSRLMRRPYMHTVAIGVAARAAISRIRNRQANIIGSGSSIGMLRISRGGSIAIPKIP